MKFPFPSPFKKYTDAIKSAQSAVSTLDVIRNRNSDHEFIMGVAKLYKPDATDYKFLDDIIWAPLTIPAPHLGFQVRPGTQKNAVINQHGFRDSQINYSNKPFGVYRIFMTGGSTTFGSGTETQGGTLASQMQSILNEQVAPRTGRRYEVINAGIPGITSIHEQIIIHTRISLMNPDRVIMFSGHNDIHYARKQADPNWRWVHSQHNYMLFLNELYKDAGENLGCPLSYSLHRRMSGVELARQTFRNVMVAALGVQFSGSTLTYILQPDIWSTRKPLTIRERAVFEQLDAGERAYWNECQGELRRQLAQSPFGSGIGYSFLDASQIFQEFNESDEMFIDSCHFTDRSNRYIAQKMVDGLAW